MATNTAGTVARQFQQQLVHYLRKGITFANAGTAVEVGTIPAGALIMAPTSGWAVTTVFVSTAGGVPVLDIGTTTTADLYATDLSSTGLRFLPLDEGVNFTVSADTKIMATLGSSGTVTAGAAEIVIAYIPDNDK
jgi:hypothetical protein